VGGKLAATVQGFPDGTFPIEDWRKTVEDFNKLCAYCQKNRYQERDHFIPKTRGGKTEVGNLLPACTLCNKRKSNLTGNALIAVFGEEKINGLAAYLVSRSSTTIVFPVERARSTTKSGIRLIVKEIAQSQGFTQEALAAEAGLTVQLVNRYWNNNMQRVDLDAIARLSDALKVKSGELFVDEDK
jgi:DNA-binding Xre family transcriptional regulator